MKGIHRAAPGLFLWESADVRALLRAPDDRSFRAAVTAASRNQRGERQEILLREVLQGDEAPYIGSLEFAPREELQIVVEARPAERKDKKVHVPGGLRSSGAASSSAQARQ